MNLGAHSRDRRFSTPVSATPNRESDFSNLSFHRSVEIRTAALAPLLASSHSQRVADLALPHEPSLSCGDGRAWPTPWSPASNASTGTGRAPAGETGSRGRWDKWRIEQIAATATAFVLAGLAHALVMAALWHRAEIAAVAFVFTCGIAPAHAVLFGLPLFWVFRAKGWINILT